MRLVTITAIASLVALLAPGLALAGESCGGGGAESVVSHIFDAADQDGSGSLTAAEYGEAGLEDFGVSFADSDTNQDGETSKAEYLELYERIHTERISL